MAKVETVTGDVVIGVTTGKGVYMRVLATGEWSGRDVENLYEMIGLSLREGCFDAGNATQPERDGRGNG